MTYKNNKIITAVVEEVTILKDLLSKAAETAESFNKQPQDKITKAHINDKTSSVYYVHKNIYEDEDIEILDKEDSYLYNLKAKIICLLCSQFPIQIWALGDKGKEITSIDKCPICKVTTGISIGEIIPNEPEEDLKANKEEIYDIDGIPLSERGNLNRGIDMSLVFEIKCHSCFYTLTYYFELEQILSSVEFCCGNCRDDLVIPESIMAFLVTRVANKKVANYNEGEELEDN